MLPEEWYDNVFKLSIPLFSEFENPVKKLFTIFPGKGLPDSVQ